MRPTGRRLRWITTVISGRILSGGCVASATINQLFLQNRMISASDRNLRFGWWSLLVFLSLGGMLETLHGFKVGWYVDVGNEMRRLMFTLAHAHGTALALVNIVAALTARNVENFELRASVSTCLIWSGILFPLGFFLGGIVTYGGDPGLGV